MNEADKMPNPGNAPEGLGEKKPELKALREAKGLSLNDVFLVTRVSLINLQALEDGDFDRLPPPVYARNFIRKYAQAVGIDENPLLARYARHLENQKPPREEPEVRKPWPENGRRYRFLFVSLAAVILAGIFVYALFLYDQSGSDKSPPLGVMPAAPSSPAPAQKDVATAPTAEDKARTISPESPPSAPPKVKGAPVPGEPVPSLPRPSITNAAPPTTQVSGKMHHLVIEARELTWIRITEDRNPPYQALLKPGERIERLASDYFLLDIGNAGGLNLTFQGKNLGSLGKRGQIIHLRLPEKTADRKVP